MPVSAILTIFCLVCVWGCCWKTQASFCECACERLYMCNDIIFLSWGSFWHLSNIINNTSYISVLCFSGRVTEQRERDRGDVLPSSVNNTGRLERDLLQANQLYITVRDHKFTWQLFCKSILVRAQAGHRPARSLFLLLWWPFCPKWSHSSWNLEYKSHLPKTFSIVVVNFHHEWSRLV